MSSYQEEEPSNIIISGAGIVGLVLALALKKHVGITAELYEKASSFQDDVGAGMGMYANGLRVIRDISPSLLSSIRNNGYPYRYRRWERHDGTEVVVAEENVLSDNDAEVQSMGIRRWRLQKILYDAVKDADIPIHFGKRICTFNKRDDDDLVEVMFEDGTRRLTKVLFGADGNKSTIRKIVGPSSKLEYTGVTCLMGIAKLPRPSQGVCYPIASTSKCHGCFFPTGEEEQCFQFHFPTSIKKLDKKNWAQLSEKVGKDECADLAERLRTEGWHENYLAPLSNSTNAVKVGFCLLKPGLKKFVYGRVVLLGDAAHPSVPYIGQVAQMGMEDAGIIATLLKELCLNEDGHWDVTNFGAAMEIYERMRIPRTKELIKTSKAMGKLQQKCSMNKKYNDYKEEIIKRDIFFHQTMEDMLPGATYKYAEEVAKALEKDGILPVLQGKKENAGD
mmetsp:Transcript_2882/g.5238  ORF Transcript_2882/g.5238 Transcript_2882/m.5238 type:complete len:448 (-) Transcript_2882:2308-3651(-)